MRKKVDKISPRYHTTRQYKLSEEEWERFFSKRPESAPEECWEWRGTINGDGYGVMKVGRVMYQAHRLSYYLSTGTIPPVYMCVCHTCDNRTCNNPSHLWLGTKKQNNNDMDAKGRRKRGSQVRVAKLTEEQVLAIRKMLKEKIKVRQIATNMSVSISLINQIKRRRCWKHVP